MCLYLYLPPPPPPLPLHCPDSSPVAAYLNLFLVRTAALSDSPHTPRGVPVSGRINLGLEKKFLLLPYPSKGYAMIVLRPLLAFP